ncbi:MAG: FMN-binding protein [Pseudomonadota bacterium]
MKGRLVALVLGLLLWLPPPARADMPLEQFLRQSFPGADPEAQMLWLTPPLRQRAAAILGHEYPGLRVKYWRQGERTAWVLDEIGKERPITIGVAVAQGRIVQLQVLAFRESRGGEVRHGFFTRQFDRAGLKRGDRLDRSIDGITGATLSVSAVSRVARLALAFHDEAARGR